MRATTFVIIIAILGGAAFYAHKAGYFGKVQQTVEDSFSTHFNSGQGKYQTQKYEEAIAEFEKAIKLNSKHQDAAAAYVRMGDCYRELGQPEKALEAYNKVLTDYPDFKLRGQVEQTIEKTRALGKF